MDSSQIVEKTLSGKYLSFRINDREYAISINNVREINQISTITPVPETPDYVNGVSNLRGQVIPVIDLAIKLGLNSPVYNRRTCVIVTESKYGLVGVIVEKVREVVELFPEQIEGNRLSSNGDNDYLLGVAKLEDSLMAIIDIEIALSLHQLKTLDFSAA